jgi:hypothetical protein
MDKQSYVVTEHIFQVPASQLRSCSFRSDSHAYDSRLCKWSYTRLMRGLGLEPKYWIETHLLGLSIERPRETMLRQLRQQYRTSENSNDFTQRPQSFQADHIARRSTYPAANTNPIYSSSDRYAEGSPIFTHNTSRMSGEWPSLPGVRDSHHDAYGGYRLPGQSNSLYKTYRRTYEQRGRVPPPEGNGDSVSVSSMILGALTAVGSFISRIWQSK